MTHAEIREWIELESDEELRSERQRELLSEHLAACESCTRERAHNRQLRAALDSARIAVRPDFATAVMAALPAAGWEARSPRTWAMPLTLFGLLGAAAAAVVGIEAARLQPSGPLASAFSALADLFGAALLTGGGLLGASWRGVGMAVREVVGDSTGSLVALGALAVGLNLIVWRLARRRAPASARQRDGR
jgi:hypothetical protein